VGMGALMPGATYRFTLRAGDARGSAACSMLVRVNQAPWHLPSSGLSLELWPSDGEGGRLGAAEGSARWAADDVALGVALEDYFTCELRGWTDDPEDLPLMYQVSYQVEGDGGGGILGDHTPSTVLTFVVPEAGVEEWGRSVLVHVSIRDMLGASASSSVAVRVTVKEFASPAGEGGYIDDLLSRSATTAGDGNMEESLVVVDGVALMLNSDSVVEESPGRRLASLAVERGSHVGHVLLDRQAKRERAAELVGQVVAATMITEASLERLSSSAATLLSSPQEVSDQASAVMLSVLGTLVDASLDGDDHPNLRASSSASICEGLSNLTLVRWPNASAQPAASLRVLHRLADSLAQPLVEGQQAVQVSAAMLSASVQVDSAAQLSGGPIFAAELPSPPGNGRRLSTAALSLPAAGTPALAGVRAGDPIRAQLLTLRGDPHEEAAMRVDNSTSGTLAVAEAAVGLGPVVSITLSDHASGLELDVHRLEEALNITIPLDSTAAAAAAAVGIGKAAVLSCVWWDAEVGNYSTEGCATLPNPAPAGARLYWEQRNVSAMDGNLARSWAIGNAEQVAGCEVVYDTVLPEYSGADAGYRKYIGRRCQVAKVGNAAGCWWVWQLGAFEGPGCILADELECLCSHLTDFKAANLEVQLGMGRTTFVSTDELTGLSASDLKESALLFIVMAGIIALGTTFWIISGSLHS
ncbi:hypothetical protein CYMTET_36060, partial [Cymbomonas tetramitiformis]